MVSPSKEKSLAWIKGKGSVVVGIKLFKNVYSGIADELGINFTNTVPAGGVRVTSLEDAQRNGVFFIDIKYQKAAGQTGDATIPVANDKTGTVLEAIIGQNYNGKKIIDAKSSRQT